MNDHLDFSPLSDAERESANEWVHKNALEADRPMPAPADAEAPEKAAARLFGRPPDAPSPYRDANGRVLFWVCRWNFVEDGNSEKQIRPLCWFVDGGFRFAHWPAPRPLYNLDKIQSNPNAQVVVCEGEKAADAASRIFPDSIATTSCGGAEATHLTNWAPLECRQVLIWPDNDRAGEKYACDVAVELRELGCDVLMVDVAALVAIDGGARGNNFDPVGWDAADALSDWSDHDALREAAARLAEAFDPGPNYVSFGPYTMNTRGLTVNKEVGRGNSKRTETVRVSAPFEMLGTCRDPHGQGWGKMLRWWDADGREHVRQVADYDLHGDPAVLCAKLADVGLRIERKRQRDFADYLSVVDVRGRVTVVSRTGWHDLNGRPSFVLPSETIGGRGSERVILDPMAHGPYEARGTIDDWRNGVALLARGQLLPVLAISTALSGPLLYRTGLEGGGVHFSGPSSIGKTTLLNLAASVWGPGGTTGYVRTWRATANGLEGAAAGATDTALVLDELGQVEAHELATATYALANGVGKTRAQRDGSLRESRTWRVQTISSGELPIDAKLIEDCGRKPRAGQLVRMLDIPASRRFGVFDAVAPDGDGARLAKACQVAAASAYGTAGPEFVRRLIAEQVSGEAVRAMVRKFVSDHSPHGADGQVVRVAERLGIIGVAGELATRFGLTPWRTNEPGEAAAWALGQWIEARGGTEPAEVRQGIAQVRHFIEAHGDSRFDNLNHPHDLDYPRDERSVRNRAGWRKGDGESRRWLIPPEVWKVEVCVGFDSKSVAYELAKRGMLERGNDGNSKVEKIAGTSKRVYVVTPRIFDGASLTSNRADDDQHRDLGRPINAWS